LRDGFDRKGPNFIEIPENTAAVAGQHGKPSSIVPSNNWMSIFCILYLEYAGG
jgi:hypothetical protein